MGGPGSGRRPGLGKGKRPGQKGKRGRGYDWVYNERTGKKSWFKTPKGYYTYRQGSEGWYNR